MTRFSVSRGVADFLTISWCLQIRPTWVSTAKAGIPKPTLKTTLAVFLPTPAKASNSSRVCGTMPSCRSNNCWAHSFKNFALLRYKPKRDI